MISLLNDYRVCVLVCNQNGDTGKGLQAQRIMHYWADVGVGGNGATNSGRTAYIKNEHGIYVKVILHTLPTSTLYDHEGKISVVGPGKFVDLNGMVSGRQVNGNFREAELDYIESKGLSWDNLYFSHKAFLITDFEVEDDAGNMEQGVKEGKKGIGTTGGGVGPAATAKTGRKGLRLEDLFHGEKHVKEKLGMLKKKFYPHSTISVDEVARKLLSDFQTIKPRVVDTRKLLQERYFEGDNILVEGVNGTVLDIEEGVYPFVTSTSCTKDGVFKGAGFTTEMVDPNKVICLGVVKLVNTKVGGGPFATEYGGLDSEEYCDNPKYTRDYERAKYSDADILRMLKGDNPFERGIAIRIIAEEYGATTGRPRRIGSFDKNMLRNAVVLNGPYVILTRADSYTEEGKPAIDAFDFADSYEYVGKEKEIAGERLIPGQQYHEFFTDPVILENMRGVNYQLPAYGDIRGLTSKKDLPTEAERIVQEGIEFGTGAKVAVVSTGPYLEEFIDMGL